MACCSSCYVKDFVKNAKDKWMQKVHPKKGAFRAYAAKHGGLDSDGKIKIDWARSLIGDDKVDPKVRKQANLYLTYMKAGKK